VIRARPWRWFRIRVEGLADRPFTVDGWTGLPAYRSRVQELVWAPYFAKKPAAPERGRT